MTLPANLLAMSSLILFFGLHLLSGEEKFFQSNNVCA